MELGICVRDLPAAEVARLGRFAEEHGYGDVFVPDVRGGGADAGARLSGRDAFTTLAAMFEATTTVRGAVGVAAVIFHQPVHLALTASTLHEQSEGRFTLGIGISHAESAARSGVPFPASPLATTREWAVDMASRSASGMTFGGGWDVLVGALGPRMVAVGAEHAGGVVLNWLTPGHAARTVAEVREVAGRAGTGRRPRTVLYCRVSPRDALMADAVSYDRLDNYHRHFVRQELHDPEAIVAGTSIPANDPVLARERIAAYADAGLDLLCLYAHGYDEAERLRVLAALAG
jgi:alkanesulfonate monooxygenase SsuD/methylene tetrahydromethanopterin reductase-like flavin-dependent oxidoreductase (luciferase family)